MGAFFFMAHVFEILPDWPRLTIDGDEYDAICVYQATHSIRAKIIALTATRPDLLKIVPAIDKNGLQIAGSMMLVVRTGHRIIQTPAGFAVE